MKKAFPFPPKPSNKGAKPSAKVAQKFGGKETKAEEKLEGRPFKKGGMAKKGC